MSYVQTLPALAKAYQVGPTAAGVSAMAVDSPPTISASATPSVDGPGSPHASSSKKRKLPDNEEVKLNGVTVDGSFAAPPLATLLEGDKVSEYR